MILNNANLEGPNGTNYKNVVSVQFGTKANEAVHYVRGADGKIGTADDVVLITGKNGLRVATDSEEDMAILQKGFGLQETTSAREKANFKHPDAGKTADDVSMESIDVIPQAAIDGFRSRSRGN